MEETLLVIPRVSKISVQLNNGPNRIDSEIRFDLFGSSSFYLFKI